MNVWSFLMIWIQFMNGSNLYRIYIGYLNVLRYNLKKLIKINTRLTIAITVAYGVLVINYAMGCDKFWYQSLRL